MSCTHAARTGPVRRAALALTLLALPLAAPLAAQTLDAVDRGTYRCCYFHFPDGTSYFAGISGSVESRNFFVFDLATVAGPITSASLVLDVGTVATFLGSHDYALFHVATSVAALTNGTATATEWNDLANGTSYGAVTIGAAAAGTQVSIAFNADGLLALKAARGGLFAIGGAITNLDPDFFFFDQNAFGDTSAGVSRLVVETEPPPSPWTDLGGGTSGVAGPPALTMSGPLTPFSLLTLDLEDGAPSAWAYLFIAFESTPFPFIGGTLHAFPLAEFLLVATDPAGGIHASVEWPPGVPSDQGFWFQVKVVDASVVPFGAALSNGVVGVTP